MAFQAKVDVLGQLTQLFGRLNSPEDISEELVLLRQQCESVLAEERQRAVLFISDECDGQNTVRTCEFSKLQFPKSQLDRSLLCLPVR